MERKSSSEAGKSSDIIDDTIKERTEKRKKAEEDKKSSVALQNKDDEKKKKAEEDKKSSVASQNKEDEAKKSDVRKVSRQKPSKKQKNKEIEDCQGNVQTTNIYGAADGMEKVVQTKDEGDGRGLVEERKPQSFEISLYLMMKQDGDSFRGFTRTNTTEIQKSFIPARQAQINQLQELISLCLRHDNLLKVEQSVRTMDGEDCFLLSSEDVCTLKCYFNRSSCGTSYKSNDTWWHAIKDLFLKVFRGVIRGLMYLFDKGKLCGDLAFNSFVNSEGEGRILPSMAAGKQKEDLRQLLDLMRSVIQLAVPSHSDISFYPSHLKHFFDTVKNFNGSCPLDFIVDHPYFWNTEEKVNFTFRLRDLVKRQSKPFIYFLRMKLKNQKYENWQQSLQHIYKRLLDNAKERCKVKGYRKNVDIVMFYGAVYTHINESEYTKDREGQRFSVERIESDLAGFFPDFYVDMHWCLCWLHQENRGITVDDLRGLSTASSLRNK